MNYSVIKKYDIANGPGIRTSLFVTGCTFACPGCFNSELWSFKAGKPFDDEAKETLFKLLSDSHCKGLSVLGGEPTIQGDDMLRLLQEVRKTFSTLKSVWLWTGHYLGELRGTEKDIVSYCDFIVDGRFNEKLSGKHLLFRGSSNQTIWQRVGELGKFEFIRSSLND